MRRAALLAGLLGTIVLLLIAGASAAPPPRTWTVCPSGCDYTDIQTAIVAGTTMPGDTILIKHSGSPYTVNAGNHIADSGKQLIIEGDPSGPRPVIRDFTAGDTTVTINTPNTIVRHLRIEADGSGTPTAVSLVGQAEGQGGGETKPAILVDAVVKSKGVGVSLDASQIEVATIHGTTVGVTSDVGGGFVSGAVVTASAGTALLATPTNPVCGTGGGCQPPHNLVVINVDAFGSKNALEAQGSPDKTVNNPGIIAARNTIARGGTKDIIGDPKPAGSDPAKGEVFIDHTNYRITRSSGITSKGKGNQHGDPKFVNAAGGNYHLRSGSPCIDHGVYDPPFTIFDADGKRFGYPLDIGAFRSVP